MNNLLKNSEKIQKELELVCSVYGINLCEWKAHGSFEINLSNPNSQYFFSVLYKRTNLS